MMTTFINKNLLRNWLSESFLLKVFKILLVIVLALLSTYSGKRSLGIVDFAVADTILFQDGFEAGQDTLGNFINWDETPAYGGLGTALAADDTIIFYHGHHSARFELTDGTQGGWAYASKIIPWPADNKLWYSCCLRNGPRSQSNVVIGGLYFMEAYIIHPSGYRERANLETHPNAQLPDRQFILRMTYRGRDGQRHRQQINIPVLNRERWYRVRMLVDLSGSNPYYAWWLNDSLIWSEYDTSTGNDTLPPTEFHVGACWIDWAAGNRAQVWIDSCTVIASGGQRVDEEIEAKVKSADLEIRVEKNPFLKKTNLLCHIPNQERISLVIYDISGREVKRLIDGVVLPPGPLAIPLQSEDLGAGVYFIKLSTGNKYTTAKVVLLK